MQQLLGVLTPGPPEADGEHISSDTLQRFLLALGALTFSKLPRLRTIGASVRQG